jgi:hypothetical protein
MMEGDDIKRDKKGVDEQPFSSPIKRVLNFQKL